MICVNGDKNAGRCLIKESDHRADEKGYNILL